MIKIVTPTPTVTPIPTRRYGRDISWEDAAVVDTVALAYTVIISITENLKEGRIAMEAGQDLFDSQRASDVYKYAGALDIVGRSMMGLHVRDNADLGYLRSAGVSLTLASDNMHDLLRTGKIFYIGWYGDNLASAMRDMSLALDLLGLSWDVDFVLQNRQSN